MKAEPVKAWQPLTFGGVARYAHDWLGRLVVTCLIVSLCTAAAVLWTVRRAWFPVIEQAIQNLPNGTEIRGGRLRAPESKRLAENSFLAIALESREDANIASSSEVQITLAPDGVRLRSLFGNMVVPYRLEWTLALNRADLGPWWEAWRPAVLTYLAFGTIFFLFASWAALAIPYAIIPLLVAIVSTPKKDVSVWGSWKLSVAALMSGAVFMAIAIVVYGFGQLRVPEMIGAFVVHFVVGWVFLFGGAFYLPIDWDNPFLDQPEKNPFAGEKSPLEPYEESSDGESSAGESDRD
jgi:hypothetical protein